MCGIGGYARPGESHLDWLAAEGIVTFENTDAVFEVAEDRRFDLVWRSFIEPPDGPYSRLRIEAAYAHGAVWATWKTDVIIIDGASAIHRHPELRCALELHPVVAAGESVLQPPTVHAPFADEEIKIMCVVGHFGLSCLQGCVDR